ncbi:calmodulin-like [Ptychodera flava]|uniref:calmodulin-like n=1 Tax=Ptychodera flava TaxID=63121 RepID=UPI003969D314
MDHRITVAQLTEAFAPFKNGNNRIMSKDLGNVLRSLGQNPTDAELQVITKDVASENGSIYFANFVSMMRRTKDDEEELKQYFGKIDEDGDGFLTIVDLRRIFGSLDENLTDEEMYEMLVEADNDGDGKLNYEEFMGVMNAN